MSGAALTVDSVTCELGGRRVVEEVSLQVAPGEVVGLLGPNGSGKSTLLRAVYRVRRPTGGRVLLDGTDVWTRRPGWVARRIGVVLQDMPGDFPLTVREVVMMGRSAGKRAFEPDDDRDRALTEAALGVFDLTGLAHRRFAQLSGGERQRALIARAVVARPGLLVMDEPTNHLDVHHQLGVLERVRELGCTALVALHDLNLAARFCDRICLLDGGRLVASGTPGEVLSAAVLEPVYRVPVLVQPHPVTGGPLVVF